MRVYFITREFSEKINGEWDIGTYKFLMDTYSMRLWKCHGNNDDFNILDESKFSLMMLQYPEYIIQVHYTLLQYCK